MRNRSPHPLTVLGAVSLVGYLVAAFGLGATSAAVDVHAFLALFGALFLLHLFAWRLARRRSGVGEILVWAFLFRLALVPAGLPEERRLDALADDLRSERVAYRTFLLYDNDVWRYFWDGHVGAADHDPYATTPAEWERRYDDGDPGAEALLRDDLWLDLRDRVYFPDYTTVYPPLAQALFRLHHALAPGSVAVFKLLLVLLDLGTCLLVAALARRLGHSPSAVVLYAWNPLAIKEIAGSGHVDALAIFLTVLAVYLLVTDRVRSSLLAISGAVAAKLSPAILAAVFLRRVPPRFWALPAVFVAIAYLPFLGSLGEMARGFLRFSREWAFNPGPWELVRQLAETVGWPDRPVASAVCGVAILGLIAWVVRRDDASSRHLVTGAAILLGGIVVLSPTVMPWYLLWALPFAALAGSLAWTVLTGMSFLSYLIYIDQVEHAWWLWMEYAVFFAVLGWEIRRGRGFLERRSSLRVGPGSTVEDVRKVRASRGTESS